MMLENFNTDQANTSNSKKEEEVEEENSIKITENISNELFKSFDSEIDKLINLGIKNKILIM